MEVLLIYLWLKLDDLQLILLIGAMLGCMGCLYHLVENITIPRWLKIWTPILVVVLILLPDSKQAAIMVGTHYAVRAAESPEAVKVMTLIRMKANELLDKAIQEELHNAAKSDKK
jgi:outer membrane lipopolysaccharide assembly protein LptE/RlpB